MKKIFIFFILINVFAAKAEVQWQLSNGLCGGAVNAIEIQGSEIFVATEKNGLFISTNEGRRWENKSEGLPENNISAIVISDNFLFAGTSKNGVYRSSDLGNTWLPVNDGIEDQEIIKMACNDNALLAASQKTIYRSTNNGESWSEYSPVSSYIMDVIENKGVFYYVDLNLGVYASTDNALTWKRIFDQLGVSCIAVNGDSILVGGDNVYKSDNGGAEWKKILEWAGIEDISFYGKTILIGAYLISTDNGNTWQGSGSDYYDEVKTLYNKEGVFYAGGKETILAKRSTKDTFWTYLGNSVVEAPYRIGGNSIFMLVATDSNVYYTDDYGKSWFKSASIKYFIEQLNVIDSTFIVKGYRGYEFSTNLGITWEKNEEWKDEFIYDIEGSEGIWYMGAEKGMFRSFNKGKTWEALPITKAVVCVEIEGSTLYACTRNTIWKSTDRGVTWDSVYTSGRIFSLVATQEKLYIKTDNGLEYFPFDKDDWDGLDKALGQSPEVYRKYNDNVFVLFSNNNEVIYVKSPNKRWGVSKAPTTIRDFYVVNDAVYTLCISSGKNTIWKTTVSSIVNDPEHKWIKTESQLNSVVNSLSWVGNDIWATTRNLGLYKSTDNGNSWLHSSKGLVDINITSFAANNGKLFAGCENGLYRSTDKGQNWSHINHSMADGRILDLLSNNESIYVAVENALYRSSDGGNNWLQFQKGISDATSVYFTATGNRVFAGTSTGDIYALTEGENTWKKLTSENFDEAIVKMESDGENIYAVLLKNGIAKSTDNGETWTIVNKGESNIEIKAIESHKGNLYVGNTKGVYTSQNKGNTWESYGLLNNSISALAIHDNMLYAGTESSILWKAELEENTTGMAESTPKSRGNGLNIFPNPAYDKITVQLPEMSAGVVEYIITDQLGRIMYEGTSSSNVEKITVSIQNLPAGMYIFTTEINGKKVQEKFMILR